MRAFKSIVALTLLLFAFKSTALAQESRNGNLAEQQKAPTVLGGTGLFNTFSTRTLCRGEFSFGLFWNNFNRDPGDLDINQVPFNFTVGLTNRWELWVNWMAWQQTTSRNPLLLSGYDYNAFRLAGDPFSLLGPPTGGTGGGGAAFFPGTEAPFGGILPRVGLLSSSPALRSQLPSFYNDLSFFGETEFIGFDGLGRPVLGARESSNGSGDVYIGSKVNLIDPNKSWFSAAVGGYFKIPISRDDHARARGRTSGEFEYGPVLMLGQEFLGHRLRIYENIGYIHTGDIERRDIKILDLRDKLLLSGGVSVAINKYAEALGELGYTRFIGGGTPRLFSNHPLDLTLGMRFYLRDGAISFGGAYRYFVTNKNSNSIALSSVALVPCVRTSGGDDHHHDKDKDKDKPCFEEIERSVRFNDNGDSHGFTGFFSIGSRKSCPPIPIPTCTIEMTPSSVDQGQRLTVTARSTTPGYSVDKITYGYRWEVKDSQGRVIPITSSNPSTDIPTSRLACGSYSVSMTVTATASSADCPSGCANEGQTTCVGSFVVTEPPCPTISCEVIASPSSVVEGGRVTLRATRADGNLRYGWSTTGGRLLSATGTEVTLDTTGVTGSVTVTVSASTDRTRCDEPCPGASCSTTVRVERVPPPAEPTPLVPPCGPIYFPFNSARVNNEHKACLDDIALQLQQDPRSRLIVDAHRDMSERAGISLTRAYSARDYLVNEKGIGLDRITVRNFSDTCSHESGDPVLNRRVEFWVLPEGVDVSRVDQVKRCGPGPQPRVVTNEQPAQPVERRPARPAPGRRDRRPEPVSTDSPNADNSLEEEPMSDGSTQVAAVERRPNAPITVRAVGTRMIGGALRITVEMDGLAEFTDFTLDAPPRVVIDISGVRGGFGNKVIDIGAVWVERVRVGEPKPGVMRIVLDTKASTLYRVTRDGTSLIILVGETTTSAGTGKDE